MNIIKTNWDWKSGLSVRPDTKYIVLHHAASISCTAKDVDRWHKANGWSGIGYHFFVRKDGNIYEGRPEWSIGSHAEGKNSESIGICAEGNYDIKKTMPDAQKLAIKELLTYLKNKYPNIGIKAHKDVGATGCPGKYYPLQEMKDFWNESEEHTMTPAEKKKFNEMVKIVSELANPMIYNYIDDNMPEWARPTIQKLVDKGFLQGDENGLGLTDDLLRVLVINDRAGLYD